MQLSQGQAPRSIRGGNRARAFSRGLLLFCLLLATPPLALAKAAPEWVERNGSSKDHPPERYLLGFAEATGKADALESAKQQAAADLARQVSVQIEADVVDVLQESKGKIRNDLTSRIRATSDIRLDGIHFETHRKRKRVWALAILERLPAATARRRQRDRALVRTRECLDSAEREEQAGRASQALAIYRGCRTPLSEALEHEAIASALSRSGLLGDDVATQLARHEARIQARVRAIPHEDAASIRNAAEGLATQLARAGVGRGRAVQIAPFLYQSRDVSSPFGRELGLALESAIGRVAPIGTASNGTISLVSDSAERGRSAIVVRGSYREIDGSDASSGFTLRANAKEASSGRLLASAEIRLSASGVPSGIETRPPRFEGFAAEADKLAGGEVVSGDLRVELRTDKGLNGLVYDEGEQLSIFVRVNQPAWVRLIYILANGAHVPVEQSWYLDGSKVNQLVEYPSSFEVVAPFGVEMIHAMAHTERPPTLVTRQTSIDGQAYEVVADGADQVVRHRGIARKKKKQVAEQTLQLTTLRSTPR